MVVSTKTVKITVTLTPELLDGVERERKAKRETRSQLVRRAVELLLSRQRRDDAVDQYLRGYRETPETQEETAETHRLSCTVLAGEPWE